MNHINLDLAKRLKELGVIREFEFGDLVCVKDTGEIGIVFEVYPSNPVIGILRERTDFYYELRRWYHVDALVWLPTLEWMLEQLKSMFIFGGLHTDSIAKTLIAVLEHDTKEQST